MTIKVKIKNEVLNIPESIDFLGCTLDQINYKQKPDETRSEKQILIEYYAAHPLELRIPNQFLYLTFKKYLLFDLEERDYESLIEHIITEELELDGEICKIKSNGETRQSARQSKKYSVGLKVEEKSKRDNINKCKKINEFALVIGLDTATEYGKVTSADISYRDLAFAPKKLDCRILTKLLKKEKTTYICFSDLIYKKFTEILKNEELVSLPQIDFSGYVDELDRIINTQLFMKKLCSNEYPLDVIKELENFKQGNYGDKFWIAIENILRNISERNGCTGNSLGTYLDCLSSDDSNRRLFDETKYLIMALGRNNLAHGKLVRSHSDQKYLAILCMKAIRDVYLNWCFFQSLGKCFDEMKSDLNISSEELWKIYNGNKHGNEQYLFSWDEIPGNDSKRLIGFLKMNYGIDWVKTAEIKKIDNGKIIKASFETNYASLILNNDKTKVNLRINDGRTDEFEAKMKDEKLKIYYKKMKITVDSSGEWDSDTQMKIKFENSSTKEDKNYVYNINLVKDKIEVIQ